MMRSFDKLSPDEAKFLVATAAINETAQLNLMKVLAKGLEPDFNIQELRTMVEAGQLTEEAFIKLVSGN